MYLKLCIDISHLLQNICSIDRVQNQDGKCGFPKASHRGTHRKRRNETICPRVPCKTQRILLFFYYKVKP